MKKFLLILSLLISAPSFAQNKESFLRDGNTLYTDSSYNEAEIQYRKSLEKDQDYLKVLGNELLMYIKMLEVVILKEHMVKLKIEVVN